MLQSLANPQAALCREDGKTAAAACLATVLQIISEDASVLHGGHRTHFSLNIGIIN